MRSQSRLLELYVFFMKSFRPFSIYHLRSLACRSGMAAVLFFGPVWSLDSGADGPSKGAEIGSAPDNPGKDTASVPSAAAAVIPADPLLPEIMGPGERLMWGEHGLMRLIGAFPLTEDSREREIRLRRTMLTAHEVGGFLTLASMIATVTFGQMTLNGREDLGETHETLAGVTIGSYFLTAALSLMSPPPMVRRKEWNTISIHKGLAFVHFTGMVLTPLLADEIAGEGANQGRIDRDKARVHQVSGYITTAAFATAMLVVTF